MARPVVSQCEMGDWDERNREKTFTVGRSYTTSHAVPAWDRGRHRRCRRFCRVATSDCRPQAPMFWDDVHCPPKRQDGSASLVGDEQPVRPIMEGRTKVVDHIGGGGEWRRTDEEEDRLLWARDWLPYMILFCQLPHMLFFANYHIWIDCVVTKEEADYIGKLIVLPKIN